MLIIVLLMLLFVFLAVKAVPRRRPDIVAIFLVMAVATPVFYDLLRLPHHPH